MTTFYIGFTSVPDADTARILQPLEPPANYSKPDTIAAWRAKAEEQRTQAAPLTPYLGRLESVYVLNEDGKRVTEFAGGGASGPRLADWLAEQRSSDGSLRVVALNADFLKWAIVAAELRSPAAASRVPIWRIENGRAVFRYEFVDPADVLLPAEARRHISLPGWWAWLGIPAAPLYTARDTAEAAYLLAQRLRLWL